MIRVPQIRLIDHENQQRGVVPTFEAKNLAKELGLDLVEVSPTENPPVCRIMDYGKFLYNQRKKQKQSHSTIQTLKEIRLRPKTDDHDREVKINHAVEFLEKGCKVQFTMLFKGRERFNREFAMEKFKAIQDHLGDKVEVVRPPTSEGRRMTMIVKPAKGGKGS